MYSFPYNKDVEFYLWSHIYYRGKSKKKDVYYNKYGKYNELDYQFQT